MSFSGISTGHFENIPRFSRRENWLGFPLDIEA